MKLICAKLSPKIIRLNFWLCLSALPSSLHRALHLVILLLMSCSAREFRCGERQGGSLEWGDERVIWKRPWLFWACGYGCLRVFVNEYIRYRLYVTHGAVIGRARSNSDSDTRSVLVETTSSKFRHFEINHRFPATRHKWFHTPWELTKCKISGFSHAWNHWVKVELSSFTMNFVYGKVTHTRNSLYWTR